jgi:hypothetical protein
MVPFPARCSSVSLGTTFSKQMPEQLNEEPAAPAPEVIPDALHLSISNWEPREGCGILKANFSATIVLFALRIDGMGYFERHHRRWVQMPRRKRGEEKIAMAEFTSSEAENWFVRECLMAIDRYREAKT